LDGERFDHIARAWASGSRRNLLGGVVTVVVAGLPGRSAADPRKGKASKDQRHARRPKQGEPAKGRDQARRSAQYRQDKNTHQSQQDIRDKRITSERRRDTSHEGCRGIGAACASNKDCCGGLCQQRGACTKKKRKKGSKKTVLTGACRCAASNCVPDNAACAGKDCGDAINNCGARISCGTCPGLQTCEDGTCVSFSPPPPAPTGLQAEALDNLRIRLTWNDVSGEDGYFVNKGDDVIALLGAGATTYTVGGLAPGTSHCYFVRAYSQNGGVSGQSDQACALTPNSCVAGNPAANEVLLYEHTYYGGRCEVFTGDDASLGGNPIGNEAASSIKVGSGVHAYIYEHSDFTGNWWYFSPGESVPELRDTPIHNDTASSIRVCGEAGCSGTCPPELVFESCSETALCDAGSAYACCDSESTGYCCSGANDIPCGEQCCSAFSEQCIETGDDRSCLWVNGTRVQPSLVRIRRPR
jgi:hypothetical protein